MLHPIPIPLVDNCLFIDNSSLEYIITCPRSAEYYINQKRERNRDRSALKFGGILHKILETRYRDFDSRPITDVVQARMLQVCLAEFNEYTPPEDDYRNYQMAVDFIDEYCAVYRNEPFDILTLPGGKPAVELPFAVPLFTLDVGHSITVRNPDGSITQQSPGSITIIWQGRSDLLYRREGSIYGMDHKSTSMMGPLYFKEFELSGQIRGYSWALGKLIGQAIKGFTINGLGIRKPTKTGKKLELQRYTIDFSDDNLCEWQEDTITAITTYLHQCFDGFLPRHHKWCIGKYGACQFFDVCTLPREQRELMLSTNDYKTVTWNPLNNEN